VRWLATAALAAALAGCGSGSHDQAAPPPPAVLAVRGPDTDATAFDIGGGRAVTVAHVVRAGRPVVVAERRARVVRIDRRLDVAVLALRGRGHGAVRGAAAGVGQRVTVRVLRDGGPRSLPATVRRTITARVRGRGGAVRVRPALELAAAVMPGDSGAPVVDGRGRVVGVVFAQASDRDALAYALDARALHSVLPP
jgi:serine protease Do